MRKIENIVIHCTAGPQSQTPAQIVSYHLRTLKWKKPGYHYIVAPDGTVVNTVSEAEVANGVKGHNASSIHIAYIGGIDPATGKGTDNRTAAQKEAIIRTLRDLRRRYPHARILGHRDIASTDSNGNGVIDPWERVKECPCFDAIPEYSSL